MLLGALRLNLSCIQFPLHYHPKTIIGTVITLWVRTTQILFR